MLELGGVQACVNPHLQEPKLADQHRGCMPKKDGQVRRLFSVLYVRCWGRSIRTGDSSRLCEMIRKAGSITGSSLGMFETVVERSLSKLLSIHPSIHL